MRGYLIGISIICLATVLATALMCRVRIRHHKRVSYGTVIVGASVFPFMLCATIILLFGFDVMADSPTLFWLNTFGTYACVCALPAFGVVHYYQKRSKRDETPVA